MFLTKLPASLISHLKGKSKRFHLFTFDSQAKKPFGDKFALKGLCEALREAELKTACQINLVYQNMASGYIAIPFVIATLLTLFASFTFHLLGFNQAFLLALLQLTVWMSVFSLINWTDWKYRLTPGWLSQMLVHHRLNQAFKRVNNLQTDNFVLIMVSQREGFARVIPSVAIRAHLPEAIWTAISNSLMIDVGHGESAKGLRNSTSALSRLLTIYYPNKNGEAQPKGTNRLEIIA